MHKSFLSVFALGLLSFGFASAQPSGTPPDPAQMIANRVARLTTLLTLTTTQQSEATTIFTNAQATLSTVMTGMQAARTALKTAVQNNDQAGITTQATQIGSLTAQQVAAQAKADAAFYAILTPDQQTKYNELKGPGFGGPGFGGPGPRGGGPHP